jgi:hypothetical protein
MTDESPEREATPEEQMTWGICPVCGALPGKWCSNLSNDPPPFRVGTHAARLLAAPKTVKLVRAM